MISGNEGYGIRLSGTMGCHVLNNNITVNSRVSVNMFVSQNNILSGNRIINAADGLYLYYLSDSNIITNNEIVANTSWPGNGICIRNSSANLIWRNNFIGGRWEPYDNGNNTWSYDGEGNYWSNYAGKDSNLDGIGDMPYVIGKDSQGREIKDNFPFMQENGWLIKFFLIMNTSFPSIPITVNGTLCTTGLNGTSSLRLGYIANYEIIVAQDVQISEGNRLHFVGWEDGNMNAVRVTSLSSNASMQAIYVKQYFLKVISEFSETIGSGWYDEGAQARFSVRDVRISANPFVGKVFKGWTGDANALSQSASITIDEHKMVVAVWSDNFTGLYLIGGDAVLAAAIAVVVLIMRRRLSPKLASEISKKIKGKNLYKLLVVSIG